MERCFAHHRWSHWKLSACLLPISPLEGEMPGRAEGGEIVHRPHPLAAESPASSAATIFCTSAAVMTSGGEMMTLAPEVRTMTPAS